MDVFPSFWKLENRTVLVVGGAEAASRKLRLLTRTDASIRVFSQSVNAEIAGLAKDGRIILIEKPLTLDDIPQDTAFAIVATEDDREAEQSIAALKAAHVPVNAVDRTALCDFLIPSIVDRNPVVIGIATGGAAPILARSLREQLESSLPKRLGALAGFAGRFRKAVAATLPDGKQRKAFWERFFDGPIAQSVLDGQEAEAREAMLTSLNGSQAKEPLAGAASIVEFDPAEPDLISLRALTRLQRADIVLHSAEFDGPDLELTRRDADRIAWDHAGQAIELAEEHVRKGLQVVILARPGGLEDTDYDTMHQGGVTAAQTAEPTALTMALAIAS